MTTNDPRYDPNGPIFISYRRSDGHGYAMLLDCYLRSAGLVPWRDLIDLPPGETHVRVREAFNEGISAALLVVTPEIKDSKFVPEHELPGLLQVNAGHEEEGFMLAVLNAVADPKNETEYDVHAPCRLLTQCSGAECTKDKDERAAALNSLLHFALLPQRHELRQLVVNLLRQRVKTRLSDEKGSPGWLQIQTQTRPIGDAGDYRSGHTESSRDHDLVVRLRQDKLTGIPDEVSYWCLKDTLPLLADVLWTSGVKQLRFTGGGHPSLSWAMGAAFPSTRIGWGKFSYADIHYTSSAKEEKIWEEPDSESGINTGDGGSFKVADEVWSDLCADASGPVERIAVFLQMQRTSSRKIFQTMAQNLPGCRKAVYITVGLEQGRHMPPEQGARVAREVAKKLRALGGSSAELHICTDFPAPLVAMVARRTNTLNCVLYERGKDWATKVDRYYPTIRVQSGDSDGPITEVFPQLRMSWSTSAVQRWENLTPHPFRLYDAEGTTVIQEWPGAEKPVRVTDREELISNCEVRQNVEIPIYRVMTGALENEPPVRPGVGYIVSRVAATASSRSDFFFPFGEVRKDGTVVGAKSLAVLPASSFSTSELTTKLLHRCSACEERLKNLAQRAEEEHE